MENVRDHKEWCIFVLLVAVLTNRIALKLMVFFFKEASLWWPQFFHVALAVDLLHHTVWVFRREWDIHIFVQEEIDQSKWSWMMFNWRDLELFLKKLKLTSLSIWFWFACMHADIGVGLKKSCWHSFRLISVPFAKNKSWIHFSMWFVLQNSVWCYCWYYFLWMRTAFILKSMLQTYFVVFLLTFVITPCLVRLHVDENINSTCKPLSAQTSSTNSRHTCHLHLKLLKELYFSSDIVVHFNLSIKWYFYRANPYGMF